jgi:hypothetical protein
MTNFQFCSMYIYFASAYKNRSLIKRYIFSFFCILLLSVLAYIPINSTAQYGIREDLTGIWRGQDGSTYYVREFPNTYYDCPPYQYSCGDLKDLGRDIMWVGLSADDGKSWANVFVGKYNVDRITGTWVDVPRGKTVGSGTLSLQVDTTAAISGRPSGNWMNFNGILVISKISSTGSPFGTSSWYKPSCPIPEYSLYPESNLLLSERDCGWDRNLSAEILERILPLPPGGPPLQPPPEFGRK